MANNFETWCAVNQALRSGFRGLPGGTTLAQLLIDELNAHNPFKQLPLDEQTILKWADEHHERTGLWPTVASGRLPNSRGENWKNINKALDEGFRGMPGGSSLAQLLAKHRHLRNRMRLPDLTEPQILEWADAHFGRTGRWPNQKSGNIVDAPGETWHSIDVALRDGHRGLPGGKSLPI